MSPSLEGTTLLNELVESLEKVYAKELKTIKEITAYRSRMDHSVYESGLDMGL